MLLQQRSIKKYHFGGAWTNACCGHPVRGERLAAAAQRRLYEELGFVTELRKAFSFTYAAFDVNTGLTEREFDHVFVGEFNGVPQPNPEEIDALKWIRLEALQRDLEAAAHKYTPWFAKAIAPLAALMQGDPRSLS